MAKEGVRIDKWLWAARFFKTRNLAKNAIEGGKVKVDGQRPKPSRDLAVGDMLEIRQGREDKTVEVLALSDQRRGAPEAATLYRETPESRERRERDAELRKLGRDNRLDPGGRPSKKQRRQIHRFKESSHD